MLNPRIGPATLVRQAFQKTFTYKKTDWIRLSSIGHECDRYIYLNSTTQDLGIQEAPRKLSEQVPANIGNTLHMFYAYIIKNFVDEYKDCEIEQRFYHDGLGATGQIDVYVPSTKTIIDIKSTNRQNFNRIKKSIKIKDDWRWQVNAYGMFKGAEHGWILLVDYDTRITYKDDLSYHPLLDVYVPMDTKIQNNIVDRIMKIKTMQSKKELPDKPAHLTRGAPPCKWCDFSNYCYGDAK